MTENQFYYSEHPDVVSDPQKWNFTLLGNNILFTSDNGVFSKKTVDYGSRVLIDNVDYDIIPQGNILDLGCGYGPIGLAIAKKYSQRHVDMVDVNEIALGLARQNAESNSIENVTIFASDVYQNVSDKYAAVITNPPVRAGKNVVDRMIAEAKVHLLNEGTLTIVLQKKQGAPSAKKLMEATFGNADILKRDKGYYIIQSINEG
ncbi:class I SAM-dependent methyltransferase [Lentilactobacillus kosonis]|uniref:Ribosomal RNA small subunit methyltransferase C n=1 Tax=Lentilactobacillus kosonis TaxID=2810561 RepID=A0A401FJX1_9LACO|nr:class I SAM-dependent methyltransferase [Lentilactobacillus kosonis]GAY72637.1 ribosomal RNA small subunit methyltransferase C [Lentilactobacillus kosonis]